MTDSKKTTDPLHVDAQAINPAEGTKHMCDSAPDKEKCEEFVERLGEASANIRPMTN